MEIGLNKRELISQLTKSTHGNLAGYVDTGLRGAQLAPEFFSRLLVWNTEKGQIRDSQIALPIIGLRRLTEPEFRENALAILANLDPRSLWAAVEFSTGRYWVKTERVNAKNKKKKDITWTQERDIRVAVSNKLMRRLVNRYLADREAHAGIWERNVLTHRDSMYKLYRWAHRVPGGSADHWMNRVLMFREYAPNTAFAAVRDLKTMTPSDAVRAIQHYKIPTLVYLPALGDKLKDTDVALLVIESMSPTELVTNIKLFEKFGWRKVPALRGALDKALEKAAQSKKNTLKTGHMANIREVSDELKGKLQNLQEKQIDQNLRIKGNWLILGDKSPSMQVAIEPTKEVAAILARSVEGKVHVVFFDSQPRYFDVSGKTHAEIKEMMKHVRVEGNGTSIGVGLRYAMENNFEVDGIAILTDAQENAAPLFVDTYKSYVKKFDNEPSVYVYRFTQGMRGYADRDLASSLNAASIEFSEFDLRGGVDYYSLPNLVLTMRPGRYSLLDEIMSTQLRRLDDVLKNTTQMEVLHVPSTLAAAGR